MITIWNKLKGAGGSGGGGSASFPTVVTDSGSSLPVDLSGYQANDTFLNTSDKKIYKTTADSYELDTNARIVTANASDVTINVISGVANNFSFDFSNNQYHYSYLLRDLLPDNKYLWTGEKEYRFHFKLTNIGTLNTIYMLMSIQAKVQYSSYNSVCIIVKNSKLYIREDSDTTYTPVLLVDYELEIDKEYYVRLLKKSDGKVETIIYENGYEQTVLANNIVEPQIADVTSTFGQDKNKILYGAYFRGTNNSLGNGFSIGEIYLLDSSGEFLVPSSVLSWDNGTDLTDKTEYADKTNGILYLYENDELVKIGGSLTKKVYTISADNTSTLDVSSDFTKVVDVLKNGVELALTDDYTISSGVITFVTALSTTDKITVKGE